MSRNPWDAAIVVDEAMALRLVCDAFPDLVGAPISYVGAGWDNTAWRVGDWLFRFPRRRIARVLLQAEIDVVTPLSARLPLQISAPTRVGEPTDDYPYPWAGYRWMTGTTGCRTAHIDGPASATRLGQFLRVLHSQPTPAPTDDWRQLIPGQAKKLLRTLDGLDDDVLPNLPAVRALTQRLAHTPVFGGSPVLCHGDLYSRHLLFQDGVISGVIDWGDVHRGDPATDLAVATMVFEPADREQLFAAYGPVSPLTRQRARFRALFSGVFQAHYAHSVSDKALLAAGRTAVARALIDPQAVD